MNALRAIGLAFVGLFIGILILRESELSLLAQSKLSADQQQQLEDANRLNRDAEKLIQQGKYTEAIGPAKRVLEIRRSILGDENANTATSIDYLGYILVSQGNAKAGHSYLEQALEIRKRILGEEHQSTAISLDHIGRSLQAQGKYAAARESLEKALSIRKKALGDEHPNTATALSNLGHVLLIQGDLSAARRNFEQSLQIRKKALGGDHLSVAASFEELGLLLQNQGEYAESLRYFEQSLSIRKKAQGEEHPAVAQLYSRLGLLLQTLGDNKAAQTYHEQALKIRRKVFGNEHPLVATSLSELGWVMVGRGDYAGAQLNCEQALVIFQKTRGDENISTATCHFMLGVICKEQHNYRAAQNYFERSLDIYRKVLGEDDAGSARALQFLGILQKEQGNYAAARPYYEQSLKLISKARGNDHPFTGRYRDNLMRLETAVGNLPVAMSLTDQSRRGVRRHISRVLLGLDEQEQLRFLEVTEEKNFHSAISFGFAYRQNAEIARHSAAWLLNGKAVAQDALSERILLARDATNTETAAIVQQLVDVRRQLANLALGSGQEQLRRESLEKLSQEESKLTREVNEKTARPGQSGDPWVELEVIRRAIPADGMLIEIARFRVFNFLYKPGESMWQPARYAAWLIPPLGRGEVEIIDLGPAADLEQATQKANQILREAATPDGLLRQQGEVAAVKALSTELGRVSELAWKPLAPKIPDGTKKLVISPDGVLWMVPWAALPTKNDKCLLEEYALHYEVCGRNLAQAKPTKEKNNPPIIFADPDYDENPATTRKSIQAIFPNLDLKDDVTRGFESHTALGNVPQLPNTKLEADAVAPNLKQITGNVPTQYLGPYALETVMKHIARPRVLMLSTHGFFLPDQVAKTNDNDASEMTETRSATLLTVDGQPIENPLLRCGLLFAGCNSKQMVGGDEGILTGKEVVGIDLRGTELVVLSACETATGKVNNGQGVAGLRQAFQLAGAQSVVATLWQVPDRDSAIIMSDFFSNLAAGESRPEALRNAQLKRIQSRRERNGAAHPFFWAAWTITGA